MNVTFYGCKFKLTLIAWNKGNFENDLINWKVGEGQISSLYTVI